MKKNIQHSTNIEPDDIERIENYYDNIQQEENLPWQERKTDHRKSKSRGKGRNSRRQSPPNIPPDDFSGDLDYQ